MAFLMIGKKEASLVSRNYKYEETDSINSVQSSLKSHLVWVPLYVLLKIVFSTPK